MSPNGLGKNQIKESGVGPKMNRAEELTSEDRMERSEETKTEKTVIRREVSEEIFHEVLCQEDHHDCATQKNFADTSAPKTKQKEK